MSARRRAGRAGVRHAVVRAGGPDAVRRFGYGGLACVSLGCAVWALVLIVLPMVLMVDQAFRR